MIECFTEWWLDSRVYKVLGFFYIKFKSVCRSLYEICVIIKRKYITTPKIKNRIINDLEYNCKKTNVLLKLKEGLETIKKGKFVIIEHRGYIPRRESSFGIDVMTTLYVYNLSIKINQQNFLEYTNNQYEYNITVKEALEKVINDAFCRYTNLLNPDLKPCKTKVKIESK